MKIVITPHALNRVSTRCWRVWRKTKIHDEGLYSWTERLCRKVLKKHEGMWQKEIYDKETNINCVFQYEGDTTILITVYRNIRVEEAFNPKPKNGKAKSYFLRKNPKWETDDEQY